MGLCRCSCLAELVKKRDRDGTMPRRLVGIFVPKEREPTPTADVPSFLAKDGINGRKADKDEGVDMMLLLLLSFELVVVWFCDCDVEENHFFCSRKIETRNRRAILLFESFRG